jgi:hypothetical protein
MGDTKDIPGSLLSTIIFSVVLFELFLIVVAKYTVYFRLYIFFLNNEASFFSVSSIIIFAYYVEV